MFAGFEPRIAPFWDTGVGDRKAGGREDKVVNR